MVSYTVLNGISFLISLLLTHYFYKAIWQTFVIDFQQAILLYSFIVSRNFLGGLFRGFNVHHCMLSENRDGFTITFSIWFPLVSFSLPDCWLLIYCWIRVETMGILALFLTSVEIFQFFPIKNNIDYEIFL